MGEAFGGEWIHVYIYMLLSPFTVHLKLSQHCLLIGYTSKQNKKLKNKIKLQVEPEDGTALLQSHDKTLMVEVFLFMHEQQSVSWDRIYS